jgi:hypothetical protein
MKLRELQGREPPVDLPRVGAGDYTLLWISGYWDGPKSGMLLYKGVEHWFEMFGHNDDDDLPPRESRGFAIVVLTAEQQAKECAVHDDFRRYVGTHCDAGGLRSLQPRENWHLFYDKHLQYGRNRSFSDNEVVAWFENLPWRQER